MIDLGSLGGNQGDAYAINNKGQVVGESATKSADQHPFFWDNGVMTDLGVPRGDMSGVALSINDRGQAVGYSNSTADPMNFTTSHPLLWEKGVMAVLQTRIPAGSGWTLLQTGGINDRGQIEGSGIHNGIYRAFLLTPVP